MNGLNERIEMLLERYFDAAATDAEERELRAYFRETKELPAELEYARMLFGGLDELAAEHLPERTSEHPCTDVRTRVLSASITPQTRPPKGMHPLRRLSVIGGAVAAAVLLAGLFFGLEQLRRPYCYIDGVAVYDREVAMQTTTYLESFSAFETSDRMVDELIKNN